MNVYNETNPILNKAQIFEHQTFSQFTSQSEHEIPQSLWDNYSVQFNWMYYENETLQCRPCQQAYQLFPEKIEPDEWTTPNEYSYRSFNKDDLILILKIHDFSNNHIDSVNLLNNSANGDNFQENRTTDIVPSDSCQPIDPDSFIQPVIASSRSSSRWTHYVNNYPWLYIKNNSPGCRYCEEAFKHSTEISASKWTDPTPSSELSSIDRPYRALRRHQLSKNHQRSVEVLVDNQFITPPVDLNNHNNNRKVNQRDKYNSLKIDYPWLKYDHNDYRCAYCGPIVVDNVSLPPDDSSDRYDTLTNQIESHHQSSEHRLRDEQSRSVLLITIDDESKNDDAVFLPVVDEDQSTESRQLDTDQWNRLRVKYPWLNGENGQYFGCSVCQNTPIGVSTNPNNPWTLGPIMFQLSTTYEYLRKKLYNHNQNKNHLLRSNIENSKNDNYNDNSINNDVINDNKNDFMFTNQISFTDFLTKKFINSINESIYHPCESLSDI